MTITPDQNPDICLICMPYASLERSSLALGLINTYISAFGHRVESIYGNLQFAAMTSVDEYFLVEDVNQEALIGEWVFSRAAFAEHVRDDQAYLASLSMYTADIGQQLLRIREQAERFIDVLADQILAKNPKIVGCSSTFQQNCASLALLKKIKASRPDIITLMGGANCEGVMGQTISQSFDWVDYVFSGECDEVIGHFVHQLMEGVRFDAHNLPDGVIGHRARLITQTNSSAEPAKPPRAFVSDMSKVGIPEYTDYFTTIETLGLSSVISPGLMVESSRGCWWGAKRHCTFCGLNGHSMIHRSKSEEAMLTELQQLSSKHGVYKFGMADNILPLEYIDTVLPRLAEDPQYSLFYETKANLRHHQVKLLAKAGAKWIQPGLESLQDDFLRLIKKGSTAIQNVSTLKSSRECGVRLSWSMLAGAPGECNQWYVEMAQWLGAISHLQPPQKELVQIGFHRFSPYFDKADEYGLNLQPIKNYQVVYPLSGQALFDMAYYFHHHPASKPSHATVLPGHQLIQSALNQWSDAFWRQDHPPILSMFDHGSKIKIFDTREVATKLAHDLLGITATVYRLCAEPVGQDRLLNKLLELGEQISQSALDKLLAQLVADQLMLHLSHCYLSLALSGDIPMLPRVNDFPSGYLALGNDLVR